MHTTALQDPQRRGSELRSAQVPEQQAGVTPGHGLAAHDPQRLGSLERLVHLPLQQVGVVIGHWQDD